jgi:hypothetical protein
MQKVTNFVTKATFTTVLAIGQLIFKRVGLAVRGRSMVDGPLSVFVHPMSI